MNSKTPRSIAARLVLVGTVAASAAAFAPGVAGASSAKGVCQGKVIEATANDQTVTGTNCADTIYVRGYYGVTVKALDGNDTIYAGYGASAPYLYLGNGNDTVRNTHDRKVWVSAGSGNDVVELSSGYDAVYGDAGTDTADPNPGDFYQSIEIYV